MSMFTDKQMPGNASLVCVLLSCFNGTAITGDTFRVSALRQPSPSLGGFQPSPSSRASVQDDDDGGGVTVVWPWPQESDGHFSSSQQGPASCHSLGRGSQASLSDQLSYFCRFGLQQALPRGKDDLRSLGYWA
jgi:hypothetical protein